MREILFKAKRSDNGEWVEGNLVTRKYAGTDEVFQAHIVIDAYEQMNVLNYGTQPVLISPVTINEFEECCFRVDINTICQYTGLTDKNGNKIWENDIVKKVDTNALGYHRERICTVSWDDNGYWLLMTTLGDGYFIGEFRSEQLEVIGNIFDNPELLEVDE